MATVVSMDDIQKAVVSILQASATAYGSGSTGDAPDGSNRQYASATEIDDAILYADAEVCTAIINCLQHPFQTTFVQTSSAINPGGNLPARNGMILKVMGLNGELNKSVSTMDGTTNRITITAHGFETGQKIQFSAVTPPIGGGLTAATDYYVIVVDANTIQVAASPLAAYQTSAIDLSLIEPGGDTIANLQYIEAFKGRSADEVKEALQFAGVYGMDNTDNSVVPVFFIEGDILYSTAYYNKVVYTDYTKTSSPQAPQPYRNALVAGALATLLKDGSDESMTNYYAQRYQGYIQAISQGATVLPQFAEYAIN